MSKKHNGAFLLNCVTEKEGSYEIKGVLLGQTTPGKLPALVQLENLAQGCPKNFARHRKMFT
jgi:hypothetical protein